MGSEVTVALALMIAIKHFLADWQLQSTWMVHGKRRRGFRFIIPLLSHVSIHGVLTLYVTSAWFIATHPALIQSLDFFAHEFPIEKVTLFAGIDAVSHFIIDRSKALFERFSENRKFRIELTLLDQFFHGIVYLFVFYYMLNTN